MTELNSPSPTEKKPTLEQQPALEQLNQKIDAAYPSKDWGMVSSTAVVPDFRKQFYGALEEGQASGDWMAADAHSRRVIEEKGYQGVYTAQSLEPNDLKGTSRSVWENHQQPFLQKTAEQLGDLLKNLDQEYGMLPTFIREEYKTKIENEIRNCEMGINIGSVEFTKHQSPESFWNGLIDPEKFTATKQLSMRYEQDALAILQTNREQKKNKIVTPPQFSSIGESLKHWHLSEAELAELGVTPEQLAGTALPAEQIQKFFELLIARSAPLEGWEAVIDPSKTSIDVDPRARKVSIPPTRVFTPDDAVFIPAHEFIHIMGAANGKQQSLGFLETGMSDYLATEEGKAVLAEMMAGQKFGHERQVKMAARYYAVGLALKTNQEADGSLSARYSMQEIYNTLKSYEVSTADAKEIVWRLMRGTSLRRQMSEIPVMGETVAVPELNAKDAVYFQGQMELFYEFFENLGLPAHDKQTLEKAKTRDFSNPLLARAGRAMLGEGRELLETRSNREAYGQLVALGREKLLEITQYFLMGKINLAKLKENPEWLSVIQTNSPDFAQYKDLLKPADQASVVSQTAT